MENDHLDIWVKISTQIGELNGFIKTALDKLADHEKRLDDLEKGKGSSLKDSVIALSIKGLVIAIISLGSVVGAGTLIGKILGM